MTGLPKGTRNRIGLLLLLLLILAGVWIATAPPDDGAETSVSALARARRAAHDMFAQWWSGDAGKKARKQPAAQKRADAGKAAQEKPNIAVRVIDELSKPIKGAKLVFRPAVGGASQSAQA